jgi:hypothetical protein
MAGSMTTADRIPLADLEGIITRALVPGDYEHSTTWIDGHAAEVDTPPEHIMTADILTAALPEPDNDGTLGKQEAALSILKWPGREGHWERWRPFTGPHGRHRQADSSFPLVPVPAGAGRLRAPPAAPAKLTAWS